MGKLTDKPQVAADDEACDRYTGFIERMPDAHEIYPCLWQGRWPKHGARLFDVIISMAQPVIPYEHQQVYHFPIRDVLFAHEMNRLFHEKVETASRIAADAVSESKRTLVSCNAGLNRSGLVVALALRKLTDCTGIEAAERVQAKRPGALYNGNFIKLLREIG